MTNRIEKSEQQIAKRAQIEEQVKELNALMGDHKFDEAAKLDEAIQQEVNEYTAMAKREMFNVCKATDDPMLAAVTYLTFETIGVRDAAKEEGVTIPVKEVIDKERPIDLLALHNDVGAIGADPKWSHIAMKLNMLLTAQKCVDLGLNPKQVNDSYAMSDIARDIDLGKNPASKTKLLGTLQMVISAMLGEDYKATSHDVNYLMSIYSRKSRKALTVACANHRHFRNYMAEVCHRIVTGASYNVDFKKKGEDKTAKQPIEIPANTEQKAA